jgi:predicted amidohydrolase
MRLAIGQAPPRERLEENVAAAAHLAHMAADAGSDLLLLSELFLSGYAPDRIADDPGRWAVHEGDARLAPLREACRERSIKVLVGAAYQDERRRLTNAVLLLDQNGGVERIYAKVHLWQPEKRGFDAGDRLTVLNLNGIKAGIGVCYDAGFPEFCRSYAAYGVDLLLFASSFAHGEEEARYDIYHPARALENGVYLAVANSVGEFAGAKFFGRSQIFGPRGACLIELSDDMGVGAYDIQPGAASNQGLPYLADLRTHLAVVEKGK